MEWMTPDQIFINFTNVEGDMEIPEGWENDPNEELGPENQEMTIPHRNSCIHSYALNKKMSHRLILNDDPLIGVLLTDDIDKDVCKFEHHSSLDNELAQEMLQWMNGNEDPDPELSSRILPNHEEIEINEQITFAEFYSSIITNNEGSNEVEVDESSSTSES